MESKKNSNIPVKTQPLETAKKVVKSPTKKIKTLDQVQVVIPVMLKTP